MLPQPLSLPLSTPCTVHGASNGVRAMPPAISTNGAVWTATASSADETDARGAPICDDATAADYIPVRHRPPLWPPPKNLVSTLLIAGRPWTWAPRLTLDDELALESSL